MTALYKVAISRLPQLNKIPYGDPYWSTFNASFQNRLFEPDMLLQAVYDGHALTTWHCNNWREAKNYSCGQHLGLDFDQGDKTSSMPYLLNDKFIMRYGSFLYSTMSHTPEEPRTRVIFLLDTPIMQAKNYALAAAALLWLFGTADRKCKDACRFFYGSPKCECEYINQVLPLDVVKKLIADYQATGNIEKHKAMNKDFHAPASQQEVEEALRHIRPWDIDYDEWLSILMGIHAAFGESGYSLAEAWADGKPGEVERKWKSFDPCGNEAGTVTIGTVFGIAKRFGWQKAAVL